MKIKSVVALMVSTLVIGSSAVPCFASNIPLAGSTKVLATTLKKANSNSPTSGICKVLGNILREENSREWKTGYISTAVNVREKPDLESEEVGNLFLNDMVKYYNYNDQWCAILFNSSVKYVSSDYVCNKMIRVVDKPVKAESVEVDNAVYQASPLTREEDLLSRGITAESSVLGEHGMMCTGSVILNRKESEEFANSIEEVLYEPGQYECVSNGSIDGPANETAIKVAKKLLAEGSILPENVVYQAEFPQGEGVYCTVGNTYYCY